MVKAESKIPELRFPEFEGEWVEKKLGEVLNITSSSRVHKDEWTKKGVPFFRSSDVVADFKGTKNTKAYIPFELYDSLSNKIGRVKKDDLLVTGGGSIGIPFLVKNNEPLYFKDADLLWIKNTNTINGYFLYSFFLTQSFKKYIKSVSHVGTIAHYTVIQVKNTPCQFPSLPEQQKIATFLTAVDNKIKQFTKKKALMEQYKKGVMQKFFSQEIRFKDNNGKEFPDWQKRKLNESLYEHGTKSTGIEEVFSVSVHKGLINQIEHLGRSFAAKTTSHYNLVKPHDIVYTKSPTGDFPLGIIKFSKIDKNVIVSPLYGVFTPVTPALGYILDVYFESKVNVSNYLSSIIQKGAKNTINITNSTFLSKKILLPVSHDEQQKISDFLTSISDKVEQVNAQLENAKAFKKGLLQQMFV